MARKRRTSAALETARQRLAALKQIDAIPDFGSTLLNSDFRPLTADFCLSSVHDEDQRGIFIAVDGH